MRRLIRVPGRDRDAPANSTGDTTRSLSSVIACRHLLPMTVEVTKSSLSAEEALPSGATLTLLYIRSQRLVSFVDEHEQAFTEPPSFSQCRFEVLPQDGQIAEQAADGQDPARELYTSAKDILDLPADTRPEKVKKRRKLHSFARTGKLIK